MTGSRRLELRAVPKLNLSELPNSNSCHSTNKNASSPKSKNNSPASTKPSPTSSASRPTSSATKPPSSKPPSKAASSKPKPNSPAAKAALRNRRATPATHPRNRRSQWKGKGKYKEPAAPDTTDLPALPEGWAWARLDGIASLKGGLTVESKSRKSTKQRDEFRIYELLMFNAAI